MDALKRLPWRSLILSTLLAIIAIKVLEFILSLGYTYVPDFFTWMVTPIGGLALDIIGGLAFGGLGALFLQRIDRLQANYVTTLWGLVLCLLVGLFICARIFVGPVSLVAESAVHLFGVLIGVFWRGRLRF